MQGYDFYFVFLLALVLPKIIFLYLCTFRLPIEKTQVGEGLFLEGTIANIHYA